MLLSDSFYQFILIQLCVLGTKYSPIQTPGEIMSFGVSPVNYSDSVVPGVPAFGIFIGSVAVAVVQWAEVTRNKYAVTVIVFNS